MTRSWHRKQWERNQQMRSNPKLYKPESAASAFPLIRKVDTEKAVGLSSLLAQAVEAYNQENEEQTIGTVVLRGALDKTHAVTILGQIEMGHRKGLLHIPRDKQAFITEFREKSESSQKTLTAKPKTIGIFSRKLHSAVNFGVTLDDETVQLLRQERQTAIELLDGKPEDFKTWHPHISLGKIMLGSVSTESIRPYINQQLESIEAIPLLPTRVNH